MGVPGPNEGHDGRIPGARRVVMLLALALAGWVAWDTWGRAALDGLAPHEHTSAPPALPPAGPRWTEAAIDPADDTDLVPAPYMAMLAYRETLIAGLSFLHGAS